MVAVACILSLTVAFAACNNGDGGTDDETPKGFQTDDALVGTDYVDYANEVYLNTTDYPQLEGDGLKLIRYNGVDDLTDLDANDVGSFENDFDPDLPNIILVHGVQLGGGRDGGGYMETDNRYDEINSSLYDADKEIDYFKNDSAFAYNHEMGEYWHDGAEGGQKYNVFYFNYFHFADCLGAGEVAVRDAYYSGLVVSKIWSRTQGVNAIYYDSTTSSYVETPDGEALGGYSVAEFFAAEYIRAFNNVLSLYPDYATAGHQTYVASHSMGGVVSTASTMLLKLLAEDGQIAEALTPSRLLQMDSFVGLPMADVPDETIAWSDKNYTADADGNLSPAYTYIAATEALSLKYNVAIDFYMNEYLGVPFTCMASWSVADGKWIGARAVEANRIMAVTAMVMIKPYFIDVDNILSGGHNPIREWVLSSYLYDAPTVEVDGVTYTVPTAKMSNADVLAARGTYYEMMPRNTDGSFVGLKSNGSMKEATLHTETIRCDDDCFVKRA